MFLELVDFLDASAEPPEESRLWDLEVIAAWQELQERSKEESEVVPRRSRLQTALHRENLNRKVYRLLDVQAYLDRIGFDRSKDGGPLAPTAETLRALQVAHLRAVPFENLSIHAGQPIVLDVDALFEKVVVRRRGGFCYELNGLFAALLRALGFEVTQLSAGVARRDGTFGPDFDHMTLLVHLDERWLTDVGFGDSFLEPLRLDARGEQVQGDRAYRIDEDGMHLILQQRQGADGPWEPQYRFTLQPRELPDYAGMCQFHQTSPQSHFTQKRVCSLATADGRVTLSDLRLITTRGGVREERMLPGEAEHAAALRELFGVVV